jgi:hypothetical protein
VFIFGQIECLLEVTKEKVEIDMAGGLIIPLTGLFALVESQEDSLPYPGIRLELAVKGSKRLKLKQQKKRKVDGRPVRMLNLHLVPVESPEEPISAIPNLGGELGNFIFVCPVNTWADSFSDYTALCYET